MSSYIQVSLLCLLLLLIGGRVYAACLSSNLPTVENSVHNGTGNNEVGAVVTYECQTGYTYSMRHPNPVPVTCLSNGSFIGSVPTCDADDQKLGSGFGCEDSNLCCPSQDNSCKSLTGCYCDAACTTFGDCCSDYAGYCQGVTVDCPAGLLPSVANGYHGGNGSYVEGDIVWYSCNSGYVFEDSPNKLTCSSDGTFTGTISTCIQTCPYSGLPTVAHSNHNGDAPIEQGEVITYTCHANYVLQHGSQNTQTCTSGSFTGPVPVCLHICPSTVLPTISHATHDGDGTYMAGDVVTYTCNVDYVIQHESHNVLTCSVGGAFAGAAPVCVDENKYVPVDTACYANGTIVIENPDTDTYLSAHASDIVNPCITTWLGDGTNQKKWLLIAGCDKDSTVTIVFSSRLEQDDEIYGGDKVASYVIKCKDIDVTGAVQTVTQGFMPHLSLGTESPVAITVDVKSALRLDSALGEIQTTATVGDELYWTIDVPEEYSVILTSCTAYAGKSMDGTTTKQLVDSGCTTDADLISSFSDMKVVTGIAGIKRYYTTMWAFKFQSDDYVFFHCDIKLCPGGSTHCDINCSSRKKRSAGHDGAGTVYGTTSRMLRVNPASVYISSSTTSRIQQDMVIASAITLICWLIKTLFV